MPLGAVAFVPLKSVLRILFGEGAHQPVAAHFGDNRGERDDRHQRIAINNGVLFVTLRRLQESVEHDKNICGLLCEMAHTATDSATYRAGYAELIYIPIVGKPHAKTDVARLFAHDRLFIYLFPFFLRQKLRVPYTRKLRRDVESLGHRDDPHADRPCEGPPPRLIHPDYPLSHCNSILNLCRRGLSHCTCTRITRYSKPCLKSRNWSRRPKRPGARRWHLPTSTIFTAP